MVGRFTARRATSSEPAPAEEAASPVLEGVSWTVFPETEGDQNAAATQAEIEDFRRALVANPAGYIAQPTLSLSSCPTYVDAGIAPRHIDLRPFVLSGRDVQMVAGGLTRVALQEGSLVVNSPQGGGTKDTWVLGDDAAFTQSASASMGRMTQSMGGMTQTLGGF